MFRKIVLIVFVLLAGASSVYALSYERFEVESSGDGVVRDGLGWYSVADVSSSGGYALASRDAGDFISYEFWGASVEVVGEKAYNRGICWVYLDGVLVAVVDEYSASSVYDFQLYYGEFDYGRHVVDFYVSGGKNAASSQYWCSVDYIEVGSEDFQGKIRGLSDTDLMYLYIFLGVAFIVAGMFYEGVLFFFLFPMIADYGLYEVEFISFYFILLGMRKLFVWFQSYNLER